MDNYNFNSLTRFIDVAIVFIASLLGIVVLTMLLMFCETPPPDYDEYEDWERENAKKKNEKGKVILEKPIR